MPPRGSGKQSGALVAHPVGQLLVATTGCLHPSGARVGHCVLQYDTDWSGKETIMKRHVEVNK